LIPVNLENDKALHKNLIKGGAGMDKDKSLEASLEEIESLQNELKKIREDIDQSYYRIPKKEFETITVKNITQEVSEQVNKRINIWRNILATVFPSLLIVLSILGYKEWGSFKEQLNKNKEELSRTFEKNQTSLQEKIQIGLAGGSAELREGINKHQDRSDAFVKNELDQITRISEEKARSAAAKETRQQIESIRNDIRFAQKTVLRTELNGLRKTSDKKVALIRLEPLLKKAIEIDDPELVSEFLDEMFSLSVSTSQYENLDKLNSDYKKYAPYYTSTTWANIAIADMFLYEEKNAAIYKQRAIDAYKKALEVLPDYGTPYAVRLIIHMIDYERQKNVGIKEQEKQGAYQLLESINSGRIFITSYEAYNYLRQIRNIPAVKPYIAMLHDTSPEQMALMEKRYEDYKILQEQKKE
jgi:hypothetical protein